MDDLAQFKQTFFAECEELLGDLEGHLMALQSGEGDNNTLNAVFRAIHSIKGGAGAFGFDRLVAFAHIFETVLDLMRDGRLEPTPDSVLLVLHRSEERRVGKACVSTCRYRGSPDHEKKTKCKK